MLAHGSVYCIKQSVQVTAMTFLLQWMLCDILASQNFRLAALSCLPVVLSGTSAWMAWSDSCQCLWWWWAAIFAIHFTATFWSVSMHAACKSYFSKRLTEVTYGHVLIDKYYIHIVLSKFQLMWTKYHVMWLRWNSCPCHDSHECMIQSQFDFERVEFCMIQISHIKSIDHMGTTAMSFHF